MIRDGAEWVYRVGNSGTPEDLPSAGDRWPLREERVGISFEGTPERAALGILKGEGWSGYHTEGNLVRSIFRALLLPHLEKINPFPDIMGGDRTLTHAIHYLVPSLAGGKAAMLSGSMHVDRKAIEEMHRYMRSRIDARVNIQEDFEKICEASRQVWPMTPPDGVDAMRYLSVIPRGFWHGLLEVYSRFDGALAHGWPDLELTNGREVLMVEVKVKDRLTSHQRETMPALIGMGINMRILRLIKV